MFQAGNLVPLEAQRPSRSGFPPFDRMMLTSEHEFRFSWGRNTSQALWFCYHPSIFASFPHHFSMCPGKSDSFNSTWSKMFRNLRPTESPGQLRNQAVVLPHPSWFWLEKITEIEGFNLAMFHHFGGSATTSPSY